MAKNNKKAKAANPATDAEFASDLNAETNADKSAQRRANQQNR